MSLTVQEVITPGNADAFTVGQQREANAISALAPEYLMLLEGPVTATLATMNKNGRPQLTPVWVDHDGTFINLNSVRGRLKDRNLRARPEVTLMFLNPATPYHWMTIWGTVEQVIDEDDPAQGHLATNNIDDLAELYLGQRPYPFRSGPEEIRVLYRVRPTRVQTFGAP